MTETIRYRPMSAKFRTGLFITLLLMINVVMDGLPELASPFLIQIVLLPFTAFFLVSSFYFLTEKSWSSARIVKNCVERLAKPNLMVWAIVVMESLFVALFFYQTRHFAKFGYRPIGLTFWLTFTLVLGSIVFLAFRYANVPSWIQLMVYLSAYGVGQILSIVNFPLSYLRSDMLPVIFWSDRALLAGRNPYQHFYVAERIYDFPYLPGQLLVFAPAQALHLDLRWASILYIAGAMLLLYGATLPVFRAQAAVLIGLYVLCPYLQYRHELYTQAHFFSLILIFVLLHRRMFVWSTAVFGISMVISQFSWVIFPFFLLYGLRRNGWKEVARMVIVAAVVALILLAPFLHSGAGSIAHNAVGQWDRLERPIARPINLAFWATFLIRPINLKWLQLVLLSAIFAFCWLKGRCSDLIDTLRWMIAALLIFILFNVLVDGYFYLMLLVPMLVYTCVANGWWSSGSSVPLCEKSLENAEPLNS